ncbi:helix-turn-helix domain-containing protein [Gilliamella sp. N-W3]|uniref:helix-turn-helix domain-containing protein n=1 Tax=Gilliamella sp. N-W3 TaxID=1970474 RepID=UPI00117B6152|nr:helix-turn-helix domain-containing protein [Gilliamella sp. N-W3]
MNQDLSINFGAAYMTVEEYAKHSGMKVKTIKDYVLKGYLPVRKKTSPANDQSF